MEVYLLEMCLLHYVWQYILFLPFLQDVLIPMCRFHSEYTQYQTFHFSVTLEDISENCVYWDPINRVTIYLFFLQTNLINIALIL